MTLLCNSEVPVEAKNKAKGRLCAETNRRGTGKMAPCRTTTKWSMSGIEAGSSTGHTDILSDSVTWFFTKCLKVEDDTQADYSMTSTHCGYQGSVLLQIAPLFTLNAGCNTREGGLMLRLKRLKVLVPRLSPERNVCPSAYSRYSEMEDIIFILSPT